MLLFVVQTLKARFQKAVQFS